MIVFALISLGYLAFLIVSLVKWHLLPFHAFEGMIMITQPDSMLWFFCHIWVKTTFNMSIIWWRCFLILCKGMLYECFPKKSITSLVNFFEIVLKQWHYDGNDIESFNAKSFINTNLRYFFPWKEFHTEYPKISSINMV